MRRPRPPRRSKKRSARRSQRRLRFNPAEEPELDLGGVSETTTRTRRGRKEQTEAEVTAEQPFNPGQDDCKPEKVSAVIIPVNVSLVKWAQQEAERLWLTSKQKGMNYDNIGRVLVLAKAFEGIPSYSPDAWEEKGVPAVKLRGKSRDAFISECAPAVDASTPVFLVQVSSPTAGVGQLTGSIGNVDINHYYGLVRFILELIKGTMKTDRFGVQLLLPEDYLQKVRGMGKDMVPTFYSKQFFEMLREAILDEVEALGDIDPGELLRSRKKRDPAESPGMRRLATQVNDLAFKVAIQQAKSKNPAVIAAQRLKLLDSCLLRLGPPLNPRCYFPQGFTNFHMPIVPTMRKRMVENLLSRIIMATAPTGPEADMSDFYRDSMLSKVRPAARGIESLAGLREWVKGAENVPQEVKARILYPHTIITKGVDFGGEVLFSTAGGDVIPARTSTALANALAKRSGVKVSQTKKLWIGWSPSEKADAADAIVVVPEIEGIPSESLLRGPSVIRDAKGKLLEGAKAGNFSASSMTNLAKHVRKDHPRLVIFSSDPDKQMFLITCTAEDKKQSDFSAVHVPSEITDILSAVISGVGEANSAFEAFNFPQSVRIAQHGTDDIKAYGKMLKETADKLAYYRKPPHTFSFPSAKQEKRALAGPVLRVEMFPDPLASDFEIQSGLVPMVSSIQKFPDLSAARDAKKLAPQAAEVMGKRGAALKVDPAKYPSGFLPPFVLYAVALKKPIKGAPRGITLGAPDDPKTMYFLVDAFKGKRGATEMEMLPWTDHHRSLLHKGFMADVRFLPSGKIDYTPLGGALFDASLTETPLFDPNEYRTNQRVIDIYGKMLEKEEKEKAKANPEDGAEAGYKFGTPRMVSEMEYEVLKPADSQEHERMFREAVYKYLSFLHLPSMGSSELSARNMRAMLADAAVRQAMRTESGQFGAKASQSANRWGVAASRRSMPTGWAPNIQKVMTESGLMYGPDDMDIRPPSDDNTSLMREESLLSAALDAYGISLEPDTQGNITPQAQKEALEALRAKVLASPLQTLDREELEYVPAARVLGHYATEEAYDRRDAPEDEIIARLNPPQNYAEYLAENLAGDGQLGTVPDANIDFRGTRGAFPLKYANKSESQIGAQAERLAVQGRFVQFPRRKDVDGFNLAEYSDKLGSQEGLSVPEARALLGRMTDAYGRRFRSTIPASSAMCAISRTKKLKGYRFPRAIMDAGLPGFERKKVVIWVSPVQDAGDKRVMTYRRNSHLDCDIKVGATRSMGQAMALALQDTLLWLAQKDGRQRDTYVYVGRVGEATLNLAWKPGDAISFDTMLANLDDDSGSITVEMDADEDVRRYNDAALGVLGGLSEVINEDVTKRAQARSAEAPSVDDEDEETGGEEDIDFAG
jgi:hypothetical protein